MPPWIGDSIGHKLLRLLEGAVFHAFLEADALVTFPGKALTIRILAFR
jgi:hypothetical protein